MTGTMEKQEPKVWTMNATDRCDYASCGAQAYVKATGVSGDLFFCSHHFNEVNGEKLQAFAFEITDERERLIENRTKIEE